MLSIPDFVLKYEHYTDEELHEIYLNHEGYSDEALKALHIVLEKRGGLSSFLKRMEEKSIVENEIQRIKRETSQLGSKGIDSSFIKTTAVSHILSAEKVHEIIDNEFVDVEQELEDKKIKPRTITGSIIGGVIASIVGGGLWGLQLIYAHRIFYIFGIGLAFLCYGIIKSATKQTRNNIVVLVASVISVIVAIVIGQSLYEYFGAR
jgi:hypothetical protein